MPKKEKKKNWRERQRERQLKRQRAQETYRIQRETEARRKPRKWPKGKIIGIFCLLVLIFGVYGVWQYTQPTAVSEEPPQINPINLLQTPYEFTLTDINGTQFSLSSFSGKIIVMHIMGVGCHGLINPIKVNHLTQLKAVCDSFCGKEPVTLITVVVATCPSSDLVQIRATYGIKWLFGNDYDDGIMDIAEKYATHGDGTIVLIDKTFHISNSFASITASTLSSEINQLLGA